MRLGPLARLALALAPLAAYPAVGCTVVNDTSSGDDAGTSADTSPADTGGDDAQPADAADSIAPSDSAPSDSAPSDSAPSGDDADAGNSVDAACAAYASAFCTRWSGCAQVPMQLQYGDLATCEAREALACVARAQAPGSGFDVTAIQACTGDLPTTDCYAFLESWQPASCHVNGTVPDGAACGDDAQCAVDSYCRKATDVHCGTCTKYLLAGDPCDPTGPKCQLGTTCTGSPASCEMQMAAGGACMTVQDCGDGLSCVGGQCVQDSMTAGAACNGAATPDCLDAAGLYCDPSANKCYPPSVSAPGDPCLPGVSNACGASSLCLDPAGGNDFICQPTAADGAACSADVPCMPPALCIGGTCTLPDYTTCH